MSAQTNLSPDMTKEVDSFLWTLIKERILSPEDGEPESSLHHRLAYNFVGAMSTTALEEQGITYNEASSDDLAATARLTIEAWQDLLEWKYTPQSDALDIYADPILNQIPEKTLSKVIRLLREHDLPNGALSREELLNPFANDVKTDMQTSSDPVQYAAERQLDLLEERLGRQDGAAASTRHTERLGQEPTSGFGESRPKGSSR